MAPHPQTPGFQLPRSPRRPAHGDGAAPSPTRAAGAALRPGTIQTLVAPRHTRCQPHSARLRVVLLRDASGSMKGQKAREASQATNALYHELRQVPTGAQVRCGVIDFSDTAILIQSLTSLDACPVRLEDLQADGGTNITDALRLAGRILTEPQDCHDVVILFSDGEDTCGDAPDDPIEAAADLKQRGILLLTVAYGDDADLTTLEAIATSTRHCYRRTVGAEALKQFLGHVGRTLTHTILHGTDPTQTLANL